MSRVRKSEPRSKQLNLSLTERELESIQQRADAVGMRLVHFGRVLVVDEQRAIICTDKPAISSAQQLLRQEISRLGSNLNQMVKFCHQTGFPPPADLEPLLNDIRQILSREFGHGP